MRQKIGWPAAIRPALPSWYIDFTDEHATIVKLVEMPVISGTVNVRLQPRRPAQLIKAGLVIATYPVLLFVSVFAPVGRLALKAARLFVQAFHLEFPTQINGPATPEKSIEHVTESIEHVSQTIDDVMHNVERRLLAEITSHPDRPHT